MRIGRVVEARIYLGLVTFEKGSDPTGVLPPESAGACGWMAARAASEDAFVAALVEELGELGLRFVELDDVAVIASPCDVERIDPVLAENMAAWEPGTRTVWGTLRTYVGDGEA